MDKSQTAESFFHLSAS